MTASSWTARSLTNRESRYDRYLSKISWLRLSPTLPTKGYQVARQKEIDYHATRLLCKRLSLSDGMVYFKENHSGLRTRSAPVIIFLCGFPDKAESWSRLVPYFQENYHVITLNLPDYEESHLKNTWGYNLIGNEVATALAKVIQPHTSKKKQIYLVGHDWGSVVCQNYISVFPGESNHIDKLILLDVGILDNDDAFLPSIERMKQISYMTWLAFCFCISKISSELSLLLMNLYPWKFWGPCPYETDVPSNFTFSLLKNDGVKSHMTYPYFQLLVSVVRDYKYIYELMTSYKSWALPILFLYGERKAVKFHSQASLDFLDSSKNKSKWKGYPNSGHWLHWTEPEKVAQDIQDFIQKQ